MRIEDGGWRMEGARAWKSAFAKQVLPKLRIPGNWIGGWEEAEVCIADEARRLARDHGVLLRRAGA